MSFLIMSVVCSLKKQNRPQLLSTLCTKKFPFHLLAPVQNCALFLFQFSSLQKPTVLHFLQDLFILHISYILK